MRYLSPNPVRCLYKMRPFGFQDLDSERKAGGDDWDLSEWCSFQLRDTKDAPSYLNPDRNLGKKTGLFQRSFRWSMALWLPGSYTSNL